MSLAQQDDSALIELVSKIVSEKTGVILGERQRQMVQGRIARRVRECGLTTSQEYLQYLRSNMESETVALVSLLTTHHTFFFREFEHFEHLLAKSLPKAYEAMRASGRKKLRILSAACSKGHEVYSLAMFLKKVMPADLDFEIIGGDICTESVQFAKNGVYRWDEVKTIPATYLQGNWARGTGAIADFVKVSENLRSKCNFEVMNLSQMTTPMASEKFDVVFCRNVFIYFEKELVRQSVSKLLERLHPHGDLIIGLSESLNGLDLPVMWEGPSVYRHKGFEVPAPAVTAKAQPAASAVAAKPAMVPTAQPAPAVAAPIRIFAVDDSPTVLKLLEKMSKEIGFEFLGSAKDGEEALRILTGPNAPQPNVITLDLHMPKMNGLEFLKAFRKTHQTPVIVVSSINREETQLAQQALSAGAGDYVEKPAMDRWKETTTELIAKIRVLARTSDAGKSGPTDIDKTFARTNSSSASDRRWIVVAKESDRARVMAFAANNKSRIDLVVFSGSTKEEFVNGLKTVSVKDAGQKISGSGAKRCFLVFGEADEATKALLGRYEAARVLFEEVSGAFLAKTQLRAKLGAAVDVCPATSFAYEADRIVAAAKPSAPSTSASLKTPTPTKTAVKTTSTTSSLRKAS